MLQSAYIAGFERKLFAPYGIPLQPLTLGHVQALAEVGLDLVWSGSDITKQDVATVLAVCCFADWQQAREELNNPAHLQSMVQRVVEGKDEEAQKLVDYICYYLDRPKSKTKFDPMDARIPWWWSYAEFMQTEMGRDEEEAWGTICADAFCYYASFATRNGSEQFMTHRENYLDNMVRSGKTMKDLFDEGAI
jgi:hypothetical protein